MNSDRRTNLIVAALIVSALVHLGAMFWAKPRVMTRVAADIARVVRRGPMRVSEAVSRPEPVRIEVVKDVESARPAPELGETVASVPSDVTRIPEDESRIVQPELVANDIIAQLTVDDTAPLVQTVDLESESAKPQLPRMELEVSVPGRTAPSDLAVPAQVAPVAPEFEGPVFAPLASCGVAAEPARMEMPKEVAEKTFTPPEEVLEKVDEQVVLAEREAVRSILNADRALDMQSVVDMSLSSAFSDGYTYFRLRIAAHDDLPTVPKDVVLLIDASGSIGSDRLASCRRHAKEILRTAMNTGDRFNLVAFRDRFSYCFRSWQNCDADGFAAADAWMGKLAAHGRTDVFATISSVLTLPRDPARALIALVITDGDANEGVRDTAEILSRFSELNDGLISVYMYGVKSQANRDLIDVLTHGNRGESRIFEGWRWQAGEGIGEFSEHFRDPQLTDLRVVFPAAYPVETYPSLLRNLYRGNPVELLGRIRGTPAEIAFSLRGLAGKTAYDALFRLPLSAARPDAAIPAAWARERALDSKLHLK